MTEKPRKNQILDIIRKDDRFYHFDNKYFKNDDAFVKFNLAKYSINSYYSEQSDFCADGYYLVAKECKSIDLKYNNEKYGTIAPGIYKVQDTVISYSEDGYSENAIIYELIESITDEMTIEEIKEMIINFIKKEIILESLQGQKEIKLKLEFIKNINNALLEFK